MSDFSLSLVYGFAIFLTGYLLYIEDRLSIVGVFISLVGILWFIYLATRKVRQ